MSGRVTTKLRITRPALEHMEGSQPYADWRAREAGSVREFDAATGLVGRIFTAPRRKDGSVVVVVDLTDLDNYLDSFAGAWEAGAADNVGEYPEALGELNAARAMLRRVNEAQERLRRWEGGS